MGKYVIICEINGGGDRYVDREVDREGGRLVSNGGTPVVV